MSLVGLDIGTTGCKAIAFDDEGRILGQGSREYAVQMPHPHWAEQDAEEVWGLAWQALSEAVRAARCGYSSRPISARCRFGCPTSPKRPAWGLPSWPGSPLGCIPICTRQWRVQCTWRGGSNHRPTLLRRTTAGTGCIEKCILQ